MFVLQGKELKNDERTSITCGDGVSCLLLQNITTDDSGKYDISVENMYGSDSNFASVAVEGKQLGIKSLTIDPQTFTCIIKNYKQPRQTSTILLILTNLTGHHCHLILT